MALQAEVKRVPGHRVAAGGGTGDTAAAPVAGPEARSGVREDVRLLGGRSQSGRERRTGRTVALRTGGCMISDESLLQQRQQRRRERVSTRTRPTNGPVVPPGGQIPAIAMAFKCRGGVSCWPLTLAIGSYGSLLSRSSRPAASDSRSRTRCSAAIRPARSSRRPARSSAYSRKYSRAAGSYRRKRSSSNRISSPSDSHGTANLPSVSPFHGTRS